MKHWMLEIIPGKLQFTRIRENEIWSGIIIHKCGIRFGISKGIPSFIPSSIYRKYRRIKAYYENIPVLAWSSKNEYIRHMRRIHFLGIKRLIELLIEKKLKNVKVLCIGCGWGFEVFLLSELLRGRKVSFKIVGLDLARKPLIYGKKLAKKLSVWDNVDFAIGVVEYLPFKSNTFDAITAIFGPLDHTINIAQALKEIWRVLKPGGFFLATFLNKFSLHTVLSAIKSPRFLLKFLKKAHEKIAYVTVRGFRIPTHFWNIIEISNYFSKFSMHAIEKFGIFCIIPASFKKQKMSKFHKILAFFDFYSSQILWFLGRYLMYIFEKLKDEQTLF